MSAPNSKKALYLIPGFVLVSNFFKYKKGKHWSNLDNRREVFEQIAAKYGFDALVASNWYSFSTDDIQSEKVWEKKSKNRDRRDGGKERGGRRGRKYGFDALVASNWYSFSTDDIQSEKVWKKRVKI
jgi:hypothetical protein